MEQDRISLEIIKNSKKILLLNMRFLNFSLFILDLKQDGESFGTDGKNIYYNSVFVIKEYYKDKENIKYLYLHSLLHCVFSHIFVKESYDKQLWNISCDLAIYDIINQLNFSGVKIINDWEVTKIIADVRRLNANKIYHYLLNKNYDEKTLEQLEKCLKVDDHKYWYTENSILDTSLSSNSNIQKCKEQWSNISKKVQMDIEMFSKDMGKDTSDLVFKLEQLNKEKYNYRKILKKFTQFGEVCKINDEEFDYVYYNYGLNLYKKIPLIEPLEYKNVKKVKDLVIAIDTSDSISNEIVKKFLTKTYSILSSEETFFKKFNVHIIQCDAEVKYDKKICSSDEFNFYINNLELYGRGGTDFRPVFEYVNKLVDENEFDNLKGLLYFTDGYGIFPEKKQDYDTIFVFVDIIDYNNVDVPKWSIKVLLESDEIDEI